MSPADRPSDSLDTPAPAAAPEFVEWFIENYPPGTIISDPAWHAVRIERRIGAALSEARARITELEAALNAAEYEGDGFCVECGDEFHLDDTGGYNPPCSCGMHCRSCHEAEFDRDDLDDDYPEDDDAVSAPSEPAT